MVVAQAINVREIENHHAIGSEFEMDRLSEKVQERHEKSLKAKLRRLKLRRLKLRRREMKTRTLNGFSRTVTSALVLLALVASTFIPAMAQTKRRPALRRKAPVRRVVQPAVVYYNVNAGQMIRVRMNQTSRRKRHVLATSLRLPLLCRFMRGVEVIPAGSIITGRVRR